MKSTVSKVLLTSTVAYLDILSKRCDGYQNGVKEKFNDATSFHNFNFLERLN